MTFRSLKARRGGNRRCEIAIFGGAGGGALVAQSADALAAAGANIRVIGYLNDVLPRGTLISGVQVLGAFSAWRELPDYVLFMAPLHKIKEMPARAKVISDLGIPPERWAAIIDPRSAVASDSRIGAGCFIGPFASVSPNAILGAWNTLYAGARVGHDSVLEEFVYVGTNAVVSGYCTIGHGAYVAPGAIIRDHCCVGKFATVGINSTVIEEVPANAVVHGTPARVVGKSRPDAVE